MADANLSFGYRKVDLPIVTLWSGASAICRWTLRPLLRQRIFWAIVALGAIGFLTNFAIIYIKAEISVNNPQVAKFIDSFRVTGTGEAYRNFLFFQARAVELMLAYFGVVGVACDFRAGAMNFYLSKPIGRRHWVVGKLMAAGAVLSLLTVLPGLVLFFAYGLFENLPSYWVDEWRLARGIIGYSLVIFLVDAMVLLALSATLRRPAPLLFAWSAIYIALPAASAALEFQFQTRWFRLLNLWWDIGMAGAACFGSLMDPKNYPLLPWALAVLAAVVVISTVGLARNLKAVEVVA